MLAFLSHLAFLVPRLSVLLGVERARGASPFLDGSRIEMGESLGASERPARKGLPGSFERWERGVLLPHLFGLRMRLPFQKVGGRWRGQLCDLRRRILRRCGLVSYVSVFGYVLPVI